MADSLNLNNQQEVNAQIAIGAANAVYDLNKGGAYQRAGQPLVYPADFAGNTPGYTALPVAPAGYTVTMVHNDTQSGRKRRLSTVLRPEGIVQRRRGGVCRGEGTFTSSVNVFSL